MQFLWKGLILGFSVAAPVGPIGVLCIKRTLTQGRAYGFVSGLGAAAADAMYGLVAALGLTVVSNFLMSQQTWLRIIGGCMLLYMGIKALGLKTAETSQEAEINQNTSKASENPSGLFKAFASIFILTVTNPMTILSFAAVFAGLGIGAAGKDYLSAMLLILGVFSGSALWWFLLSGGVSLFRLKLTDSSVQWINRLAGIVIVGFGIVILASLILR